MTEIQGTELEAVLQRILTGEAGHHLLPEDRAHLEGIVAAAGDPRQGPEDRGLWFWIRDRLYQAPRWLQETFLNTLNDDLAKLLHACGVRTVPSTQAGRLMSRVRFRELGRGVRRVLAARRDVTTVRQAAVIAGLMQFTDAVPDLLATIDSKELLMSLVRADCIRALWALEYEALDEVLLSYGSEVPRVAMLHAAESSVDRLIDTLDPKGWTWACCASYPELLERFGAAGGDLLGVFTSAQASPFRGEDPPWDVAKFGCVPFARALAEHGDHALLREVLRRTDDVESLRALRAQLFVEAGRAGARWALPLLQSRVASIGEDGPQSYEQDPSADLAPCDPAMETAALLWAVAVLGDADPTFDLSDGDLLEDAVAYSRILRTLSLPGTETLDESLLLQSSPHAPRFALEVEALRQGQEVAAIARCIMDGAPFEPWWTMYLLTSASEAGGRESSSLAAALNWLSEGLGVYQPRRPAVVPGEELMLWGRLVTQMPAEEAPVMQLLGRLRYASENVALATLEPLLLRDPGHCGLIGSEIACLTVVPGGFVRSMLRLLSLPLSPEGGLAAEELTVAVAMLSRSGLAGDVRSHLIRLVGGASGGDSLLAALAIAGLLPEGEELTWSREERVVEELLHALGSTDSLGNILRGDVDLSAPGVIQRLVCAESGFVRVLAVPALFGSSTPVDDAHVPFRATLLGDPDPVVQKALLSRVGRSEFTAEEVALLFASARMSDGQSALLELISAIGRLGEAAWLPMLFAFLEGDVDRKLAEALEEAMRRILSRTDESVLFLSVSDTSAVMDRYGLNPSMNTASVFEDRKAAAVRLLTLALEQTVNEDAVHTVVGRRLLLTPIRRWPPEPAMGLALDQVSFEQVASHLRVIFVDGESGGVVAEVVEEATGEILNAVFETGETAVLRAVWV